MFERIFIIAEAGSNHNGDIETAKELVRKAAEAGADAIKFQDYTLDSLFSLKYYGKTLGLQNGKWQRIISKSIFKSKWHEIIAKEAKKARIIYFSTPFSIDIVDVIDNYVPYYKIASCDITFYPFLEKVASKKKGVFLSTGASSLDEIDRAMDILKLHNLPFICIMHCIMLYPAPHNLLNLNFIDTLQMRYKQPVGFSDHSIGIEAALLSIGKGVRAIEKHFTLNKNQRGDDHKNSLSPAELGELVKKIRFHEQMLGQSKRFISERENKERIYARRGIYAGRDLKKGDRLTLKNLAFLRPNISIGVDNIYNLIGKHINQNILKGTPITISMIEGIKNEQ